VKKRLILKKKNRPGIKTVEGNGVSQGWSDKLYVERRRKKEGFTVPSAPEPWSEEPWTAKQLGTRGSHA